MLQEDQRLQIIQAELDRCWDEIYFLGCFGRDKTAERKETLQDVMRKVEAMQIPENGVLQAVLDQVRSVLSDPINEIIQMDFETEADWTKLNDILKRLKAGLSLLRTTPSVGALFAAIYDGIDQFYQPGAEWRQITNREAYFQDILRNIGERMTNRHSEFSRSLPSQVNQHIIEIEKILQK
jgi:hypothetical protein